VQQEEPSVAHEDFHGTERGECCWKVHLPCPKPSFSKVFLQGWLKEHIRPDLLDSLLLKTVGSNFSHFQEKNNVKVLSVNGVLFGSTLMNCSLEETFGNVISRLQEEQFSERRVEKVSIEDNKHR